MKKQRQAKFGRPAVGRSGGVQKQLEHYLATEDASEIAIAIGVMRLASEARRRDFSKLLQSGTYHRRSA